MTGGRSESDDARQRSARAVTGSAMERTHVCNTGGAKLERRCERQMDAHLAYSAPPGDGVIPVQQLDNKLSIIREVSGRTVKIKEMKTGGEESPA